mgnify:CR=1 FL=1
MQNPRNRGNSYEKHLMSTIRVWDDESSTYITKPVRIFPPTRGVIFDEVFLPVRGSGSSAEKKGDLKSESYLVQAKRTDKKSFTVKLDDLRKAEKEAMNLGKKPLFMVGFYSENKVTDEWVLMPKWMIND